MLHRVLARAKGQSLPIVVLMLAVIFLIIGLAIDGGLLYAQRRLMQNTADAACLAAANELAIGDTSADAQLAAIAMIENNLGPTGPGTGVNAPGTLSYAAITDVYTPTVGAGPGLTRGIELNGADVRVALTSPAFTYFMRVFGQAEYTVDARARCNAAAGGGGTPFAVARWRRYTPPYGPTNLNYDLTTDVSIPTHLASTGGTNHVVRDVLAQYRATGTDPSRISQWPGWNTVNYPGDPTLGTGLFSAPVVSATDTIPGIPVEIAGPGASPNKGGGSAFSGPVMLDLRNITFANPEFYNGLAPNTNTNSYKDFTTRTILEGYHGPWIPPGTQLGFTSGVTAGPFIGSFDQRFNVGQVISVVVYNGTVYEETGFTSTIPSGFSTLLSKSARATFSDNFPPDCNISSFANAYAFDGIVNGVTLTPLQQYGIRVTPSPSPVNVQVRAFGSVNGDTWNQLAARWTGSGKSSSWIGIDSQGRPTGTESFGIGTSGTTLNVRLQQAQTGTCSYYNPALPPDDPSNPTAPNASVGNFPVKPREGALTLYLEARDTQTGKRRGWYVRANMGTAPADQNREFYAHLSGEVDLEPIEITNSTQNLSEPLVIQTVSGTFLRRSDVSVAFDWFTGNLQPTSQPAGVTAAVNDVGTTPTLQVSVAPTAIPGRDYYLRVAVTRLGRTQWIWYYLGIKPNINNSINQYVYTLGYANFRITGITANRITGVAVSGLLTPSQVIAGHTPRLIPWHE